MKLLGTFFLPVLLLFDNKAKKFRNFRKPPDDGFIRILIFGSTGMTGTAVLSAALTCIWFRISIFTRRLKDNLKNETLERIVEGDMFDYDSVLDAMTGIDAVFFSTTYWDTMKAACEYNQGCNVVKAALASGIKHIIYVGTPYCSLYAKERCEYLLGKEQVEALVVASALPMGDVPLNCGSVFDFGQYIAKIMLRPARNIFKTIKLATGYHTVFEFAKALDNHFPDITFYDPEIPLSVYRSFDFKGSQELASMFAYYQTIKEQWPHAVAYDFCTGFLSFRDWVEVQEQNLIEAITEHTDQLILFNPVSTQVGLTSANLGQVKNQTSFAGNALKSDLAG
ncbi:hypothetical protein EGW08_013881 [Elysia chlorotica]|uniref:NmrA-like family domain-containing protein 1 n=1 Tax=Elysia chlorotica TaxID=188477 RepID=A0A3S0ZME6_ELYCH|nr:hypothetical protein EGW08_013881 [Elysia chlorotica]